MATQTKEHAFESYVEQVLLTKAGWGKGNKSDWDVERALFASEVCRFLQDTQPEQWDAMFKLHGPALESLIVEALARELNTKGILNVFRYGFKFYGKTFRVAYFKPAHGLNPEVLKLYAKNRLQVTRQVRCHPGKDDTVDLLFSVNGLPVATAELKNPNTGQNWKSGVRQYKETRDRRAPLFQFQKRSLVHFAVDPNEAHMTTELKGEETYFLPFNRGSHPGEVQCGAGNPMHPSGYATGYLWEEVLAFDSILDILGHFMFVEKSEEKQDDGHGGERYVTKERMIFPRYHQLDSVRNLIAQARVEGSGRNYLIQHSAGSGKTNSISWLAHRLSSLHGEHEAKVFDVVIVITDRRVLDKQLQDAVYQIEHAQGVVMAIDQDSRQLALALIDNTKIIVTTIQKFPFIIRGLLHAAGAESGQEAATEEQKKQIEEWRLAIATRRYAVIVDEAHSSQTGETAREFKQILGAASNETEEGEVDIEDRIAQAVEALQGKRVSFFAFTATPKGKTLELFGRKGPSGRPESFHVYSMRQAIEEGFILDVLGRYTTYKTYYRLQKKASDDPNLPKRKGTAALAKFMTLHPYNIGQKTEVIVEHFNDHVRHQLGGQAKAMVVTSSRLHAVRYKLAFDRYLADRGYDHIRPLVAFSGTVHDPDTGIDYTEPGMNKDAVSGTPIGESQLPGRFESPDYQILLVANKYQTGFDQPLLQAMYVDRRLDGVQAVQTLSRLNRAIPGKELPFVLDFVNEAEDIQRAFRPYYEKTELQEETDPSRMDQLKHELDETQVYHWAEVEAFARVFYKAPERQRSADHAAMEAQLKPASDRFKSIEDRDEKAAFRDKLSAYVRLYSFLSQVIPYGDPDLERLYSFGRLLLPHLPVDEDDTVIKLGDDVDLRYYRLQRISSEALSVREGPPVGVRGPIEVGTGRTEEQYAPLSEIIDALNERFTTQFTDEDRLFFEQVKERATRDEQIVKTALANPLDKFQLGIKKAIDRLMVERMAENDKLVTKYMEDAEFQGVAFPHLARAIFEAIREASRQTDE